MNRIRLVAFAAAAIVVAAGCSPAGATGSPATSPPGTSAPVVTSAPATAAERFDIGFIYYSQGTPSFQDYRRGVEDAAAKFGVNLNIAGTQGFDPVALAQALQDRVSAGDDGIVAPGETLEQPLGELIKAGTPLVATLNSNSNKLQTFYVGAQEVAAGKLLAKRILDAMGGTSAKGKVLIGSCVAGLPVLNLRDTGVREGLAAAPGLEIQPTFGSDVQLSKAYPIYEQQYAANPDAALIVGLCSTDTVAIGQLNTANDKKFVGSGFDITAETLKVVEDGGVVVTIGQGAYVQGYLPVRVLAESLQAGEPVPVKFYSTTSEAEIVTAANIQDWLGFYGAEGDAKIREFYRPIVEGDIESKFRPIEDVTKG